MRTQMRYPGMVLSVLLSGCAGSAGAPSREFVTISLEATAQVAGEIGRAYLLPEGGGTRVQIEVSGVPPQITTRPVHLHTFIYEGACGSLGAQPAYALLERVLAQSPTSVAAASRGGPFLVSNTAPISLQQLRAGRFAIVVKTAPADGDREIYCGNIT